MILLNLKTPRNGSIRPVVLAGMLLLSAGTARAAVFYISPSGSDASPGTQSQPLRSFARAFSLMAGGDELVLLDGVYTPATTGVIDWDAGALSSNQIPSGLSAAQRTVVRAQTPGNARLEGDFFVGRSSRKDSYILFRGLKVMGNGQFYNTAHNVLKECFFSGGFGIGTNDHDQGNTHNLVEDCVIAARNRRIVASNYRADNNVWRRVVVRGDGCNTAECAGSGNPNVRFTVYNSKHCSVQNMVILDSVLDGGEPYGDFATAQHAGAGAETPLEGNEWIGCLSLNSEDTGFHMEADSSVAPSHRLSHCVVVGRAAASSAGGINLGGDKGAVVENCTVVFRAPTTSSLLRRYDNSQNAVTRNSVAVGDAAYGVVRGGSASYLNVFGSFSGSRLYSTAVSPGDIASDPRNDGPAPSLKHPVRIEEGSALKGAAGGADVGANVLFKTGLDGTRHGDAGYNGATAAPLWPWPNEDKVKAFLCDDLGETRGLCSASSLTRYVWEMLGNPMPQDIYGGGTAQDTEAPTAPQNVAVQAASSASLTAQWAASADNVGVAGYRLDVSTDPGFAALWPGYDGLNVGNVTQAAVTGLAEDTLYHLRVKAYDAAGNLSTPGGPASARTPAAPASSTDTTTAASTGIAVGDPWRFFKGVSAPPAGWAAASFDDGAWPEGPTGIGYGDGDDATVLSDMMNGYLTVYARKAFPVADPGAVSRMVFTLDYDDGYVAYLNGVEVARGHMPAGTPSHDTPANSHEAGTPVTVDLTARKGLLVAGRNVLAVEVHNDGLGSSDLSLAPALALDFSSGQTADAEPPSAPSGLVLTAQAPDALLLSWAAASDNVGVTDYRLDLSQDPNFGGFASGYADRSLGNVLEARLTGLSADTLYHARLRARDGAGNVSSVSATVSCRTPAPPSAPPVISNVRAVNVTRNGAVVLWTTDVPATSQVEYGRTGDYGSLSPKDGTLATSHTVVLSNLSGRTYYHYRAISTNAAGQTSVSYNNTFRTAKRAPGPAGQVSPSVFTPVPADGRNDQAVFDPEVVRVLIYDMGGREVFEARGDGVSPIVWTGRDGAGRVVESGAYVATLTDLDDETVSCLIVVAK